MCKNPFASDTNPRLACRQAGMAAPTKSGQSVAILNSKNFALLSVKIREIRGKDQLLKSRCTEKEIKNPYFP
jgi:hypothetical protein